MYRFLATTPKTLQNVGSILQVLPRSVSKTSDSYGKPRAAESESFLSGSSAQYLEDMYNAWLKDPNSVHVSWDSYFRNAAYLRPPTLAPLKKNELYLSQLGGAAVIAHASPGAAAAPRVSADLSEVNDHLTVQALIRSYQVRGHLVARTNPLRKMFDINDKNTTLTDKFGTYPSEVIRYLKIEPSKLNAQYYLPPFTFIGGNETHLTLKEILKRLEFAYCRHIGVEYMHLNNVDEANFIRQRFEIPGVTELTKSEKRLMLVRLAKATLFEAFLMKKWSSEKRFGIEGCEVLMPCLKTLIDKSVEKGADKIIMGMPHRGRLNVLANICRKPLFKIFSQFQALEPEDEGSGDVKYHLGVYTETKHKTTNKNIKLVLVANPSHLEIVGPVCQGRARAEMFYANDPKGDTVLPILMHGDAAFCGEGIVYETIHLSDLPNFNTGGTVHVVVNNQIGFTTDPRYSRSSPYCTDVGRVVNAPIFHVNSDDPEAVVYVSKVAAEWRKTFHRDVVIDIVCYRRYGHNEMDEPMFTQPAMYTLINNMKNSFEKYCEDAIKQGITTEAEINTFKQQYEKILEDDFAKASKEKSVRLSDWIDSPWPGYFKDKNQLKCEPTGVSEDVLTHIGNKFSKPPPNFVIHKALERILGVRAELVKKRMADWALGEALAWGTLLKEGHHVRLSGEDVERGTFSHRHHVVHHQTKDKTRYQFLNDLYPDQAKYIVCNSPISEYGVLGFEHGYSMVNPNYLVLWEAQFGDFANNAQTLFDTMIASGQSKWIRQCGMVVLLPHGLEGQGPEHSSARVERYLELCADDPDYLPPDSPDFAMKQLREINWIVANCSTPANYFHIMRRQIKLPFRKPLMLMTPKSLLRNPEARSSFDEMIEGTEFRRLIPAEGPAAENPDGVKKLIFCTGKVFYVFRNVIKEKNLEEKIALTRVEQLCPFPFDLIQEESNKYKNAKIFWGQEEHKNSGCWMYMQPRFETALKGQRDINYVGRPPSASPASGNKVQYQREHKALIEDATKVPD